MTDVGILEFNQVVFIALAANCLEASRTDRFVHSIQPAFVGEEPVVTLVFGHCGSRFSLPAIWMQPAKLSGSDLGHRACPAHLFEGFVQSVFAFPLGYKCIHMEQIAQLSIVITQSTPNNHSHRRACPGGSPVAQHFVAVLMPKVEVKDDRVRK